VNAVLWVNNDQNFNDLFTALPIPILKPLKNWFKVVFITLIFVLQYKNFYCFLNISWPCTYASLW